MGTELPSFDSILVRLKAWSKSDVVFRDNRFDSILVRLKVIFKMNKIGTLETFRFHTGSIKRRLPLFAHNHRISSFDSILVRLKVSMAVRISIRVRVSIPYWFD